LKKKIKWLFTRCPIQNILGWLSVHLSIPY